MVFPWEGKGYMLSSYILRRPQFENNCFDVDKLCQKRVEVTL